MTRGLFATMPERADTQEAIGLNSHAPPLHSTSNSEPIHLGMPPFVWACFHHAKRQTRISKGRERQDAGGAKCLTMKTMGALSVQRQSCAVCARLKQSLLPSMRTGVSGGGATGGRTIARRSKSCRGTTPALIVPHTRLGRTEGADHTTRVLGSNGTENSLKDSRDLFDTIVHASEWAEFTALH